jgi:hypothetical protein
MSQRLQAEGTYKAVILDHGVTTTKEKGLPQWVAKFGAFQMHGQLRDDQGNLVTDQSGKPKMGWIELDDEYQITEFLPLAYIKDDGSREFTNTFHNLQDALRWQPNASDIFGSLQAHQVGGLVVQIVVGQEDYQGKTRFRVQFVNPEDFEGMGVRKLDADGLGKLQADWGSAFRAKFGGGSGAAPAPASPAPTPAPPAAAPSTPSTSASAGAAPNTASPTPAPAPAPVSQAAPAPAAGAAPQPTPQAAPATPQAAPTPATGGCTINEAWQSFLDDRGQCSDQKLGEEFYRIVHEEFGASTDEQLKALTPEQWAWVRDNGPDRIIPF